MSKINTSAGTIPTNMTLLTLSRFNGATRSRVVIAETTYTNHGHRAGYKGVVSYVDYASGATANLTSTIPTLIGDIDDWVCVIAKSGGTSPNNVLVDGVPSGVGTCSSIRPTTLTMNGSTLAPNSGIWAVSCIMVWDKVLTDADMVYLNSLIETYKSTAVLHQLVKEIFYDVCVVENRAYGTDKQTELLLFKGNNVDTEQGYDRIRLKGANILFDTYSTMTTDKTTENTRMIIDINGNVGIGTTNPNKLYVNGTTIINGVLT